MGFIILKVKVPDLNFAKTLKVNDKEYIYNFKDEIIKKTGKNDMLLNYGLFLCGQDQQSGIYLNEGKTLAYYNIDEKSKLEFIPKRRLNIEYHESNTNTLSTKDKKRFIEEIQKKLYDKLTDRLNRYFEPNFITETGETPLTIAIQNNDAEAFKLLLKYGAFIDYRMNAKHYWMTPLHYAITIRNREMITLIMKEGGCADLKDKRGYTPLFLAVLNDENEYIKLLAIASTNLKIVDKDKNGLLHLACNNNNNHLLSLLIDCGADMNTCNKDGNTPLHLSVLNNNKEMVKRLITRGCNREIINNDGKTAKGIAGLKGFTDIFELLTNFNSTLIEPPPPPFEDKDKMVSELLDDTSTRNNAAVLLRKGTMKPDSITLLLKRAASLSSSQQRLNQINNKKKKKTPPPPPLPLFDLKDINLDILNSNNLTSANSINSQLNSKRNTIISETSSNADTISVNKNTNNNNDDSSNPSSLENVSNNENENENNNETKINNEDRKESIIKESNNENNNNNNNNNNKEYLTTLNENMLNKKNFEMMINILYDMLRIINVEEKNVRSIENYKSQIENKLSRQKYEYSNYRLLKKVDEDNINSPAVEPGNKI